MEENEKSHGHGEQDGESEHVLLDVEAVYGQIYIPPNIPYALSIGEYEETIGTSFAEDEASLVVHEGAGPSDANLFYGKCIIDPNKAPRKQVKPIV